MMSADLRRSAVRIGSHALRAVLIAAIAITLFVAYGLVNNAWYHVLAVRGGSMEPAISAGDLIVITRPPERIEVGQVLTLQVDGAIVTHRVVEVRDDGTFVTQGDANDVRDDFSANEVRVVGEYRFSIPLLGMLIEPMVSGAWFTDASAAAATLDAGTWSTLGARYVDPATGRITWDALPQPVPIDLSATPFASPIPAGLETPAPTVEPAPSAAADPQPATPPATAAPTPTPSPTASASSSPSEAAAPSEAPMPSEAASASEEPEPSDAP